MKKGIQIVLMSALSLVLNSCDKKSQDIELIKDLHITRTNGINRKTIYIYKAINMEMGIEAEVNWSVSYPAEYKNKPNLFVAECNTLVYDEEGRPHKVYLKLLVNRASRQFEFKRMTENNYEMGSGEEWFFGLFQDCNECWE